MNIYSHYRVLFSVICAIGIIVFLSTDSIHAQITLKSCITAARQYHPSMSAARAATQEACRQIDIAQSNLGPNIDLIAFSQINSVIPEIIINSNSVDTHIGTITIPGFSRELGGYDSHSIDLKIQQTIYTGGLLTGNVIRAKLAADTVGFKESLQQLELDGRVAITYLMLVQALELKETAQNTIKLAKEHRNDMKNRFESGVVLENEVMKAELRVSEAENNLINTQNHVAVQAERLKILTGLDLNFAENAPSRIVFEEPLHLSVSKAVQLAYTQRPELIVFEAQIQQIEHEIEMIQREQRPTLIAFGQASYGKPGPDFPQNDWIDSYQAGVQMHLNIWDHGRRGTREAKLNATIEHIRRNQDVVKSEIEQMVVESIIGIRNANALLEVTERAVGQAEINFRLTADRFDEGTVTNTDFLDADIALANSCNQHVIARTKLDIAYVTHLLTLGENLVSEGK